MTRELKSHLHRRVTQLSVFFFGYFVALLFCSLIIAYNGPFFPDESLPRLLITLQSFWDWFALFLPASIFFYLAVGNIRFRLFPDSYDSEYDFIVRLLLGLYGRLHGPEKLEILKQKLERKYNE